MTRYDNFSLSSSDNTMHNQRIKKRSTESSNMCQTNRTASQHPSKCIMMSHTSGSFPKGRIIGVLDSNQRIQLNEQSRRPLNHTSPISLVLIPPNGPLPCLRTLWLFWLHYASKLHFVSSYSTFYTAIHPLDVFPSIMTEAGLDPPTSCPSHPRPCLHLIVSHRIFGLNGAGLQLPFAKRPCANLVGSRCGQRKKGNERSNPCTSELLIEESHELIHWNVKTQFVLETSETLSAGDSRLCSVCW